ncbi:hypothetical protein C5167_009835, partial [Papaver somniferum]
MPMPMAMAISNFLFLLILLVTRANGFDISPTSAPAASPLPGCDDCSTIDFPPPTPSSPLKNIVVMVLVPVAVFAYLAIIIYFVHFWRQHALILQQ